jgi:hypothetical protein
MEWCGGKHIYNIQGGVSDGFAGRGGDASPVIEAVIGKE